MVFKVSLRVKVIISPISRKQKGVDFVKKYHP